MGNLTDNLNIFNISLKTGVLTLIGISTVGIVGYYIFTSYNALTLGGLVKSVVSVTSTVWNILTYSKRSASGLLKRWFRIEWFVKLVFHIMYDTPTWFSTIPVATNFNIPYI